MFSDSGIRSAADQERLYESRLVKASARKKTYRSVRKITIDSDSQSMIISGSKVSLDKVIEALDEHFNIDIHSYLGK